MYMSTPFLSSDELEEGIRSHYRWLWATILGIELRTSERAVSTLNRWAISPAPSLFFVLFCFYFCFWFGLVWFGLVWFGLVWFFRDRVSLCSPGCPGNHSVGQAGLKLRNPPASASQVLGLKACATTPSSDYFFKNQPSLYHCFLCYIFCVNVHWNQNKVVYRKK